MARKPNTELRRAQIAAALLPVMARHGYEKATIQAIAKEAGLAPGLIHYHFKTKQDILLSLVQSIASQAQARFTQVLPPGASLAPGARLRAYLQARLGLGDGASSGLGAAGVMIGAEAVRQPEVRAVYQQVVQAELQVLAALLSDALAERGKDSGGAPRLAAALMALMAGAFQLSSAAGQAMPSGYAARSAIALAELSIEAEPAAPPFGR